MQCSVCQGHDDNEARFQRIIVSTGNGSTQWFVCSPDCARAWHVHQASWITLNLLVGRPPLKPIKPPPQWDENDHEVH